MFAAHFFQQMNQWLPALSRLIQPAYAATALAQQIIVQPAYLFSRRRRLLHTRVDRSTLGA